MEIRFADPGNGVGIDEGGIGEMEGTSVGDERDEAQTDGRAD